MAKTPKDFGQLIEDQLPWLRMVANRHTSCKATADDLVQDTCLRAWKARNAFDGRSLRGWLHVIMKRLWITESLKRRRRDVTLEDVDYFDSRTARKTGRDWTTEQVEAYEHLKDDLSDATLRALKRLPECYRVVLLAQVIDDMSSKEAGKKLGVPFGTCMSRGHRARNAMRQALRAG